MYLHDATQQSLGRLRLRSLSAASPRDRSRLAVLRKGHNQYPAELLRDKTASPRANSRSIEQVLAPHPRLYQYTYTIIHHKTPSTPRIGSRIAEQNLAVLRTVCRLVRLWGLIDDLNQTEALANRSARRTPTRRGRGFVVLRVLEAKITYSFKTPQIGQSTQPQAKPPRDYNSTYSSLDGRTHHLSELHGKVVFVNFWGTWRIRCVAEMPTIQKLYHSLKNDPSLAFVIASRLDTPARVRLYAKYGNYDLPFYTVEDSEIPQSLQFNQYPTTFIFAKDGSLAETQVGGADWSDPSVVASIRKLENEWRPINHKSRVTSHGLQNFTVTTTIDWTALPLILGWLNCQLCFAAAMTAAPRPASPACT